MNGNGILGYNENTAFDAQSKLNTYYDMVAYKSGSLCDLLIGGLRESWFAPESKAKVQQFYDVLVSFDAEEYKKYLEIKGKIEETLKRWANITGGIFHPIIPTSSSYKKIWSPESMLDQRNDGFVGIVQQNIPDVLSKISEKREEIIQITNDFISQYQKYNFLFGAEQMTTLFDWVRSHTNKTLEKIHEAYIIITEGLKETEEKYMQTAQANASLFSSGN